MNRRWTYTAPGIPDGEFLTKEGIPMTKRNVRALIMSYLMPFSGAVVYDIGAGTGSVAVECALAGCTVYAVERNPESLELIADNARSFGVNLNIISGEAPAILFSLPQPQRIFLGGSGGFLQEIVGVCHEKLQPGGRIVFTSVTLNSGPYVYEILKEKGYILEAVQIQSSFLRSTKGAAIWQGSNPVTIISGEKR